MQLNNYYQTKLIKVTPKKQTTLLKAMVLELP
jgi:hypothetical protein